MSQEELVELSGISNLWLMSHVKPHAGQNTYECSPTLNRNFLKTLGFFVKYFCNLMMQLWSISFVDNNDLLQCWRMRHIWKSLGLRPTWKQDNSDKVLDVWPVFKGGDGFAD